MLLGQTQAYPKKIDCHVLPFYYRDKLGSIHFQISVCHLNFFSLIKYKSLFMWLLFIGVNATYILHFESEYTLLAIDIIYVHSSTQKKVPSANIPLRKH